MKSPTMDDEPSLVGTTTLTEGMNHAMRRSLSDLHAGFFQQGT